LAVWEKNRDLNAELLQALQDTKPGEWARKTEFTPQPDGSVRRMITKRDGTIEKDEIITAEKAQVAAARAATGLSQSAFAKLLGVSLRTLQEWEQGRKTPSGAAATLLKVASRHPEVLQELSLTLHVPSEVPQQMQFAGSLETGDDRSYAIAEVFPEYVGREQELALRAYRNREGLTQKLLAELTGIPQHHISEMENGKRSIGKERARKLAEALHCDYRQLL
jgi:putative transcriptional regulator